MEYAFYWRVFLYYEYAWNIHFIRAYFFIMDMHEYAFYSRVFLYYEYPWNMHFIGAYFFIMNMHGICILFARIRYYGYAWIIHFISAYSLLCILKRLDLMPYSPIFMHIMESMDIIGNKKE